MPSKPHMLWKVNSLLVFFFFLILCFNLCSHFNSCLPLTEPVCLLRHTNTWNPSHGNVIVSAPSYGNAQYISSATPLPELDGWRKVEIWKIVSVYCIMPPAGLISWWAVISISCPSTFLPLSKGRINIQNVLCSKVRSEAVSLLCSNTLHCQLQQLYVCSNLLCAGLLGLVNHMKCFQICLPYLILFKAAIRNFLFAFYAFCISEKLFEHIRNCRKIKILSAKSSMAFGFYNLWYLPTIRLGQTLQLIPVITRAPGAERSSGWVMLSKPAAHG